MLDHIVIAIDGLSSSGKSTLAKQLAKEFSMRFIDSGAYYRSVTYYLLQHKISLTDNVEIEKALKNIQISYDFDTKSNQYQTLLNSENIESEIRSMEVSQMVSTISALPVVRIFISELLRNLKNENGIVMDGRDIGTVVFPDATLKFYITADAEVRRARRYQEMIHKGLDVTENQIQENLNARDLLDSTRVIAPLKIADDAIVIDNTLLSMEEQFERAKTIVNKRLSHP